MACGNKQCASAGFGERIEGPLKGRTIIGNAVAHRIES
jgi:hypothetical protein